MYEVTLGGTTDEAHGPHMHAIDSGALRNVSQTPSLGQRLGAWRRRPGRRHGMAKRGRRRAP